MFEELAVHVWLVTRVGDEAVVHRADLRRLLVPGLEHSADVDTKAIHRAAATYYAARPPSVTRDVAEIEEIYHRGFLDLPDDMPEEQAENVVRRLAGDIEYWPVHSRAMVKSRAGRDVQLTEEEVTSLNTAQQRVTRSARRHRRRRWPRHVIRGGDHRWRGRAVAVAPRPADGDEGGGPAADVRPGALP